MTPSTSTYRATRRRVGAKWVHTLHHEDGRLMQSRVSLRPYDFAVVVNGVARGWTNVPDQRVLEARAYAVAVPVVDAD